MVTEIFRSAAIDTHLGSWRQEVAPFLATQIGAPLHTQRAAAATTGCYVPIFEGQIVKGLSSYPSAPKGLLVRAHCEMERGLRRREG